MNQQRDREEATGGGWSAPGETGMEGSGTTTAGRRTRKRVLLRVVDFVTEKKILTEDGRLAEMTPAQQRLLWRSNTEDPALMAATMRRCVSSEEDDGGRGEGAVRIQPRETSPNNGIARLTRSPNVVSTNSSEDAEDEVFSTPQEEEESTKQRHRYRRILGLCKLLLRQQVPRGQSIEILSAAEHFLNGRPVRITDDTDLLVRSAICSLKTAAAPIAPATAALLAEAPVADKIRAPSNPGVTSLTTTRVQSAHSDTSGLNAISELGHMESPNGKVRTLKGHRRERILQKEDHAKVDDSVTVSSAGEKLATQCGDAPRPDGGATVNEKSEYKQLASPGLPDRGDFTSTANSEGNIPEQPQSSCLVSATTHEKGVAVENSTLLTATKENGSHLQNDTVFPSAATCNDDSLRADGTLDEEHSTVDSKYNHTIAEDPLCTQSIAVREQSAGDNTIMDHSNDVSSPNASPRSGYSKKKRSSAKKKRQGDTVSEKHKSGHTLHQETVSSDSTTRTTHSIVTKHRQVFSGDSEITSYMRSRELEPSEHKSIVKQRIAAFENKTISPVEADDTAARKVQICVHYIKPEEHIKKEEEASRSLEMDHTESPCTFVRAEDEEDIEADVEIVLSEPVDSYAKGIASQHQERQMAETESTLEELNAANKSHTPGDQKIEASIPVCHETEAKVERQTGDVSVDNGTQKPSDDQEHQMVNIDKEYAPEDQKINVNHKIETGDISTDNSNQNTSEAQEHQIVDTENMLDNANTASKECGLEGRNTNPSPSIRHKSEMEAQQDFLDTSTAHQAITDLITSDSGIINLTGNANSVKFREENNLSFDMQQDHGKLIDEIFRIFSEDSESLPSLPIVNDVSQAPKNEAENTVNNMGSKEMAELSADGRLSDESNTSMTFIHTDSAAASFIVTTHEVSENLVNIKNEMKDAANGMKIAESGLEEPMESVWELHNSANTGSGTLAPSVSKSAPVSPEPSRKQHKQPPAQTSVSVDIDLTDLQDELKDEDVERIYETAVVPVNVGTSADDLFEELYESLHAEEIEEEVSGQMTQPIGNLVSGEAKQETQLSGKQKENTTGIESNPEDTPHTKILTDVEDVMNSVSENNLVHEANLESPFLDRKLHEKEHIGLDSDQSVVNPITEEKSENENIEEPVLLNKGDEISRSFYEPGPARGVNINKLPDPTDIIISEYLVLPSTSKETSERLAHHGHLPTYTSEVIAGSDAASDRQKTPSLSGANYDETDIFQQQKENNFPGTNGGAEDSNSVFTVYNRDQIDESSCSAKSEASQTLLSSTSDTSSTKTIELEKDRNHLMNNEEYCPEISIEAANEEVITEPSASNPIEMAEDHLSERTQESAMRSYDTFLQEWNFQVRRQQLLMSSTERGAGDADQGIALDEFLPVESIADVSSEPMFASGNDLSPPGSTSGDSSLTRTGEFEGMLAMPEVDRCQNFDGFTSDEELMPNYNHESIKIREENTLPEILSEFCPNFLLPELEAVSNELLDTTQKTVETTVNDNKLLEENDAASDIQSTKIEPDISSALDVGPVNVAASLESIGKDEGKIIASSEEDTFDNRPDSKHVDEELKEFTSFKNIIQPTSDQLNFTYDAFGDTTALKEDEKLPCLTPSADTEAGRKTENGNTIDERQISDASASMTVTISPKIDTVFEEDSGAVNVSVDLVLKSPKCEDRSTDVQLNDVSTCEINTANEKDTDSLISPINEEHCETSQTIGGGREMRKELESNNDKGKSDQTDSTMYNEIVCLENTTSVKNAKDVVDKSDFLLKDVMATERNRKCHDVIPQKTEDFETIFTTKDISGEATGTTEGSEDINDFEDVTTASYDTSCRMVSDGITPQSGDELSNQVESEVTETILPQRIIIYRNGQCDEQGLMNSNAKFLSAATLDMQTFASHPQTEETQIMNLNIEIPCENLLNFGDYKESLPVGTKFDESQVLQEETYKIKTNSSEQGIISVNKFSVDEEDGTSEVVPPINVETDKSTTFEEASKHETTLHAQEVSSPTILDAEQRNKSTVFTESLLDDDLPVPEMVLGEKGIEEVTLHGNENTVELLLDTNEPKTTPNRESHAESECRKIENVIEDVDNKETITTDLDGRDELILLDAEKESESRNRISGLATESIRHALQETDGSSNKISFFPNIGEETERNDDVDTGTEKENLYNVCAVSLLDNKLPESVELRQENAKTAILHQDGISGELLLDVKEQIISENNEQNANSECPMTESVYEKEVTEEAMTFGLDIHHDVEETVSQPNVESRVSELHETHTSLDNICSHIDTDGKKEHYCEDDFIVTSGHSGSLPEEFAQMDLSQQKLTRNTFENELADLLSSALDDDHDEEFHLWPSDVPLGPPSPSVTPDAAKKFDDSMVDFESVIAAPNLEEALRQLEDGIQRALMQSQQAVSPAEEEANQSTPEGQYNYGEEQQAGESVDSDYVSMDDLHNSMHRSPDARGRVYNYGGNSSSPDTSRASPPRSRVPSDLPGGKCKPSFQKRMSGKADGGRMGPAEREIWGYQDDSDDESDWRDVNSVTIRAYPRVISPLPPSMVPIAEEGEDDGKKCVIEHQESISSSMSDRSQNLAIISSRPADDEHLVIKADQIDDANNNSCMVEAKLLYVSENKSPDSLEESDNKSSDNASLADNERSATLSDNSDEYSRQGSVTDSDVNGSRGDHSPSRITAISDDTQGKVTIERKLSVPIIVIEDADMIENLYNSFPPQVDNEIFSDYEYSTSWSKKRKHQRKFVFYDDTDSPEITTVTCDDGVGGKVKSEVRSKSSSSQRTNFTHIEDSQDTSADISSGIMSERSGKQCVSVNTSSESTSSDESSQSQSSVKESSSNKDITESGSKEVQISEYTHMTQQQISSTTDENSGYVIIVEHFDSKSEEGVLVNTRADSNEESQAVFYSSNAVFLSNNGTSDTSASSCCPEKYSGDEHNDTLHSEKQSRDSSLNTQSSEESTLETASTLDNSLSDRGFGGEDSNVIDNAEPQSISVNKSPKIVESNLQIENNPLVNSEDGKAEYSIQSGDTISSNSFTPVKKATSLKDLSMANERNDKRQIANDCAKEIGMGTKTSNIPQELDSDGSVSKTTERSLAEIPSNTQYWGRMTAPEDSNDHVKRQLTGSPSTGSAMTTTSSQPKKKESHWKQWWDVRVNYQKKRDRDGGGVTKRRSPSIRIPGIVNKWRQSFETGRRPSTDTVASADGGRTESRSKATNRAGRVRQWRQYWDSLAAAETEAAPTQTAKVTAKPESRLVSSAVAMFGGLQQPSATPTATPSREGVSPTPPPSYQELLISGRLDAPYAIGIPARLENIPGSPNSPPEGEHSTDIASDILHTSRSSPTNFLSTSDLTMPLALSQSVKTALSSSPIRNVPSTSPCPTNDLQTVPLASSVTSALNVEVRGPSITKSLLLTSPSSSMIDDLGNSERCSVSETFRTAFTHATKLVGNPYMQPLFASPQELPSKNSTDATAFPSSSTNKAAPYTNIVSLLINQPSTGIEGATLMKNCDEFGVIKQSSPRSLTQAGTSTSKSLTTGAAEFVAKHMISGSETLSTTNPVQGSSTTTEIFSPRNLSRESSSKTVLPDSSSTQVSRSMNDMLLPTIEVTPMNGSQENSEFAGDTKVETTGTHSSRISDDTTNLTKKLSLPATPMTRQRSSNTMDIVNRYASAIKTTEGSPSPRAVWVPHLPQRTVTNKYISAINSKYSSNTSIPSITSTKSEDARSTASIFEDAISQNISQNSVQISKTEEIRNEGQKSSRTSDEHQGSRITSANREIAEVPILDTRRTNTTGGDDAALANQAESEGNLNKQLSHQVYSATFYDAATSSNHSVQESQNEAAREIEDKVSKTRSVDVGDSSNSTEARELSEVEVKVDKRRLSMTESEILEGVREGSSVSLDRQEATSKTTVQPDKSCRERRTREKVSLAEFLKMDAQQVAEEEVASVRRLSGMFDKKDFALAQSSLRRPSVTSRENVSKAPGEDSSTPDLQQSSEAVRTSRHVGVRKSRKEVIHDTPPPVLITGKGEEDAETKNRFERARMFFQSLEQTTSCGGCDSLESISSSGKDLDLSARTKGQRKEFRGGSPSSVRSTPCSGTESLSARGGNARWQNRMAQRPGGSERLPRKVSERFHVKDLFRDVLGEGGARGIPHQQAVLAALRAVESDGPSRPLSPYEELMVGGESPDPEPEDLIPRTSPMPQDYLTEFPYLPITPAQHFRPRTALLHPTLIPRSELLKTTQ